MIRIENLQKNYKDFSLQCSLTVAPGTITGLIGPNGVGKSTTFKAILGLISPDGGKVTVLGKDVTELSPTDKQQLGVALSESGFSGYLTIKGISSILTQMYPGFDKTDFFAKCEQFHLPLTKQIKEFSSGMKAKLKVLVAISHNASLLILDEPTTGLDVSAREEILDMLRAYMEEDENRSILISSHISSDLENLCDDLYFINDGRIILHEELDTLLNNYGILKLSHEAYSTLDKSYILYQKQEAFGYSCLTNERQFYQENYPSIAMEKGSIDDLILMIMRGDKL